MIGLTVLRELRTIPSADKLSDLKFDYAGDLCHKSSIRNLQGDVSLLLSMLLCCVDGGFALPIELLTLMVSLEERNFHGSILPCDVRHLWR